MRVIQPLVPTLRILCAAVALSCASWHAHGKEVDGFTEPYRDIDVAATEMGRVVQLNVREGDRVTAGQVLAQLNDDVLSATLDIARATMEASGQLEAALAELHMYEDSLKKLQQLLERNHATPREVDRAMAQRDMAKARVKASREELKVKLLEFQRTRTQLEQRRVLSPIDGVVTHLFKDEGEFVSPNDPVVVKVVQLDPLVVVFSVPLARAKELAPDASVKVKIEAERTPVNGVVEYICPTADAQSGTTRVRVRIPNPGEAIASGVTCRLLLSGKKSDLAKASLER